MILTRIELNMNGIKDSYVIISSASSILLKDKIILIEVLDTYDSPKDITWVKQKNAEWIDLLFSKNQ